MLRRRIPWFVALALLPAQLAAAQTIPAGTLIPVRIERSVTTESAKAGEKIAVRISKAVKESGQTVAPAGAELQGRIDYVAPGTDTEDGWIRLVFTSLALPDGRTMDTQASATLTPRKSHPLRDYLWLTTVGATAGALAGGSTARVTGLLGGLLVGVLIAQHMHSSGRDLKLRAGKVVNVRLNSDLTRQ